MGNLTRYSAADLPALLDRINKNSIGMDEYFGKLFDLHETTTAASATIRSWASPSPAAMAAKAFST